MSFDNQAAAQRFDTNLQDDAQASGPPQLKALVPKQPSPTLRRVLKPYFDAAKDAAERGIKSTVCSTEDGVTLTFEKPVVQEAHEAEPPRVPLVAGQRAPKSWR